MMCCTSPVAFLFTLILAVYIYLAGVASEQCGKNYFGTLGVGVWSKYQFFNFGWKAIISFVFDGYDICNADNWPRFGDLFFSPIDLQCVFIINYMSTFCAS